MKSFYDLKLEEYRNLKKEFRGTIIGFRLYLICEVFITFGILEFIYLTVESFKISILDKNVKELPNIVNSFSPLLIVTYIICSLIAYSIYQRNLKQYYDEKGKKK